ncbi:unnamed protein product, partial [Effrenium voratum]
AGKAGAEANDSDDEWGSWATKGKKENDTRGTKQAQELTPFKQLLLKGKGKGNDGGRRDRDRRKRKRSRSRERGKGSKAGKSGSQGKSKGYTAKDQSLFKRQPGQVLPAKARPSPAPPKRPPPHHLLEGRPGDKGQPFVPLGLRPPPVPPVPAPGPGWQFSAFPMMNGQFGWFPMRPVVPPRPPLAPPVPVRPTQPVRPTPVRPIQPVRPTKRAPENSERTGDWPELKEWLGGLDRGKGIMLRYEQVLKPCGSFEALIAMAGKMTDEQLKSKFNLETQGHVIMMKNGLKLLSESSRFKVPQPPDPPKRPLQGLPPQPKSRPKAWPKP